MEIEVKPLGDRGIEIRPTGRFEGSALDELRPHLLDRVIPEPRVLLNISGLEAIGPSGLALLAMARTELETQGIRFVIECSNASIRAQMKNAGVSRFLRVEQHRSDSLLALGLELDAASIQEALEPIETADPFPRRLAVGLPMRP